MSDIFRIEKPAYDARAGVARFPYALGDLHFIETMHFPPGVDADAAASDAFGKLLDLTAVTLGVSYFKLLAPVRIAADFPLTEAGRDFAFDIYSNGLGEFYARNNLNHFGKLELDAPHDIRKGRPSPLLKDPCGAQRLANGNTVIASYGQGKPGEVKLLEVTPDKKLVWSFKDFEHFGNALPVAKILAAD